MKKISPSLLIYFVAGLVFMVSIFIDSNALTLVSKPIIAPAIFYFYLKGKPTKFNWSYGIIIALFFIGDMIALFDFDGVFVVIASIFLLAYFFFLRELINDFTQIRAWRINRTQIFTFLICIAFLLFLWIGLLDITKESHFKHWFVLVVYGLILVLLGTISTLNYIRRSSRYTTFMILAVFSFIISDVFYILKKLFVEITVFTYFNSFVQVVSYYFLTKYYILKRNEL